MEEDRIATLFKGKKVLITGGTGFLGQPLIEKLLRCTQVATIYLLLRAKKGLNPEDRLKTIFTNPLFSTLLADQPHAAKRCRIVSGDISADGLDLNALDRTMLEDELDFIFHSAATTRFDDTLPVAARINTRGTKCILDLAENCRNLIAFIHISSAYVYPKEDVLKEEVYQPPARPEEVLYAISWINEDPTGEITRKLLGDCPNTYTFTKALAESVVVKRFEQVPSIICRPSIVVPIWRDPYPGWCNNLNGPMGLFVGAGKGVIRSMYINSTSSADFMPADITINAILLSTWNYVDLKGKGTVPDKERMYNITSSTDFKVTWEEIIELGKKVIAQDIPFNNILWYPGGSMKKYKWQHYIAFFFLQIIPALFIDLLLMLFGYKPFLFRVQKRIHKGGEMFEYYTTKHWTFENRHIQNIRTNLNEKEKNLYKIDADGLNLRDYFIDCIHSLRVVNLKETDDMLPSARRTMKIMWTVDWLLKLTICGWFLYYFYSKIFY